MKRSSSAERRIRIEWKDIVGRGITTESGEMECTTEWGVNGRYYLALGHYCVCGGVFESVLLSGGCWEMYY